ncbi:MAG: hypothetical protein E7378_04375 [Clostridiales bacterium]|nr:hypothetical protein [Clostridiales bacterium]
MKKNYYKIIGCNYDADEATIRNSYLIKVKKYHPDTYTGDKIFAEQKLIELNQAYDVLKDAEKREIYNKKNRIPVKTKELNKNEPKQKEQNQVVQFFNSIGIKLAQFFKNIYNKMQYKKAQKKLKIMRKKYKKNTFTQEEIDNFKDKRNLNRFIIITFLAIVAIILILVL